MQVNADILPRETKDINPKSIGLYQLPLKITVYSSPDLKSDILYQANWDYKTFNSSSGVAEDFFLVLIQNKELAYVQVTDYNDEWVEILYDKNSNKKGWVKSEDLRFMTWRNFYNIYGRKYGLYFMKGAPVIVKNLHGSTDDSSAIIEKINKPSKIKLTVIKGNWALVTAVENNLGKTGYIRWRSDDGLIFIFPAIR